MPTIIELRFPAGGRLHATPWGRHVNEGATEWPPSTWRLQRAMVATWYLKAREIGEPTMRGVMDVLASSPASYQLPPATQSHTRHYMPGKRTDKPKVFDTFVHSIEPLRIAWPVELDDASRAALAILCERLGYLGRAESIVEAKLMPSDFTFTPNASPLPDGAAVPRGQELVRVLCPSTPDEHRAWLATKGMESEPAAKAKKGEKKGTTSSELPATIFDSLHADTGQLQKDGWLLPPGSQWRDYTRSICGFEVEGVSARHPNDGKAVTVARFAVASTVLPRILKAVSVAERVHQSLAKWADGKACASVFTGKGSDGKPLTNHGHTHIFCELGEKRDTIGFITLYAPMGFNDEAQRVIEDVQRKALWGHGGHDLELILLGFGNEDTFDVPIFRKAKRWTSLTPFVSTRHAKHHADGRPKLDADGWPIGSPAHDLLRLTKQQHQEAPKLSPPSSAIAVREDWLLRTIQFQTERFHGDGLHGHQSAAGFTMEFENPVRGPLAFGYGSHFGLGLFVPAD